MRPSLATDRISLGFWLNKRFVVDDRGAVRSIVAIAIDLLTSGDRYFLWITAVPLPRRCLQSRQHWGSRMRGVTLALSDPSWIIATWFSYCSIDPFRPKNCIYLQSDLSCLYKLNCNIFNHHARLYFLCIGPHQQSAISSGCYWRQAAGAEPASWLRNDIARPPHEPPAILSCTPGLAGDTFESTQLWHG